jgi:hypothetical protein
MRIPARTRWQLPGSARAASPAIAVVAAVALALAAVGCGSGGAATAARRHLGSGPGIERITHDLEAINAGCRLAAGPAALRAARDLGALIEAGPDDTDGPANASQTLTQLGRIAARKASCAHTPELRAALRGLAPG